MFIFLIICLMVPMMSYAASTDTFVCEKLDDSQVATIASAYMFGQKFDMGNSLSAIAWQESLAGKWKIRLGRNASFGVYHINIKTAMKRLHKKDTHFMRGIVAQHLVDNDNLSAKLAVEELKYWKKVRHSNWHKVWASYNNGYHYTKQAKQYALNIAAIIKKIKKCQPVQAYVKVIKSTRYAEL